MRPNVLTIAGFDGSGGAGLQADLKTFAALNCYGLSALTALPIQNTQGISTCYELPLQSITDQLVCLFDDIPVNAIKVGMLFTGAIIHAVADFLESHSQNIPIVLDPVMVATSGDPLLKPDAVEALVTRLFPLSTLLTPNLKEAEALTNLKASTPEEMLIMAQQVKNMGAKAVLLKGGHLPQKFDANDLFLENTKCPQWINKPRIRTPNTHGTGCTLSSAVAAYLAHGFDVATSCHKAKNYLHDALLSAKNHRLGHGAGPVDHFFNQHTIINQEIL